MRDSNPQMTTELGILSVKLCDCGRQSALTYAFFSIVRSLRSFTLTHQRKRRCRFRIAPVLEPGYWGIRHLAESFLCWLNLFFADLKLGPVDYLFRNTKDCSVWNVFMVIICLLLFLLLYREL